MSTAAATFDLMLRFGGAGDAGLLAALHERCFARGWSEGAFAAFLADPACRVVIAHGPQGGGFALARRAADEAEILTLAVVPEARRRGLADALLHALTADLAHAGVRRMFLEVEAGNEAALALYAKHGFSAVGRRAGYYRHDPASPGGDALVLALTLAPDGGER